jgi:hypothetical protein
MKGALVSTAETRICRESGKREISSVQFSSVFIVSRHSSGWQCHPFCLVVQFSTRAFMAPAFLWCWKPGRFSRETYTRRGSSLPSVSWPPLWPGPRRAVLHDPPLCRHLHGLGHQRVDADLELLVLSLPVSSARSISQHVIMLLTSRESRPSNPSRPMCELMYRLTDRLDRVPSWRGAPARRWAAPCP